MADVLPLVGVALGASGAYLATSLNERVKARRELENEWRLRKSESYLRFLKAVKAMRVLSAQMAAALGIDDESDPVDLDSGTRRLIATDDERGSAYEEVNVYGDSKVILAARDLNRAVWGLEWLARERHPSSTRDLWKQREEEYAVAVDDYVQAVRSDLGVPGTYARRAVEYPHAMEQIPVEDRNYRRHSRPADENGSV